MGHAVALKPNLLEEYQKQAAKRLTLDGNVSARIAIEERALVLVEQYSLRTSYSYIIYAKLRKMVKQLAASVALTQKFEQNYSERTRKIPVSLFVFGEGISRLANRLQAIKCEATGTLARPVYIIWCLFCSKTNLLLCI